MPTPADIEQARTIVEASVQQLSEAANAVLLALGQIRNPVERAKAVMEIRRYTTHDLAALTDGLFRDALIEAYTVGRAEHGWYGYGALAEELGLSRTRVQQVVNGTWKGGRKDNDLVASLRAGAEQARTVRRLAAAGWTTEQIGAETGLSVEAVGDLLA